MSRTVIDAYLDDLGTGLTGTWWERQAILAEIGDGLQESVEHHRAQGLSLELASQAAIEEFGGPASLAQEFVPVLASKRIHRYGLTFPIMGVVIGTLWGTAALLGSFSAVPRSLTIAGLVVMAIAVTASVPFTLLAIASTGRASGMVRIPTRLAAKGLLVTATVTMLIDGTLLITLLTLLAENPRDLVVLPVTLGALVSLARISIAVTSVPRLGPARGGNLGGAAPVRI
ncbi:permease prefix domain 1-containing protein [Nocardia sp. NPDC052001]|uniref:permease prefix domain 1-containing protein n=1 Tax=Nocardia sp. NPDC052001 TaxID=3154853 RepID=UPI003438FC1F